MATNDKGSDLDVFDDVGKKGASSYPPASSPPSAPSAPSAPARDSTPQEDGHPTSNGGQQAAAAAVPSPPPPPGRTSLPPVGPGGASPGAAPAGEVDWDDEDEATHIFDKPDDAPRLFPAAPTPAAGTPPPPPPAAGVPPVTGMSMKSTLLGLTPPLQSPLQPSLPTTTGRFSPPPPPGSPGAMRASAPPSMGPGTLPPPAIGTLPPPPATLQGLGGLPSPRPMPVPPPPVGVSSAPPPPAVPLPGVALPPVVPEPPLPMRPNTEMTALLRPPTSRTALWVGAGVVGAFVVGVALMMMPHTGRIVVNVTDPRGSAVGRVDIFIDGRKVCDTAPCIVEPVNTGTHDVKVLADGYEPPPLQTLAVESRKDAVATFALGAASRGTGLKVTGTQPGVKLYVDDREIGPLPQDLRDLAPGEHVVRLVGSERYQPIERRVSVAKDTVLDLGSVTLKVLKGKATISLGTPGARVFLVSGSDRRELPMLPISVDIDTTKTWSLVATRPGYADYNQAISFDDGQAERTYLVTLEPRTGGQTQGGWSPPPAAPAPAPVERERPATAAAAPATAAGEGFLNINSLPPSNCFVDGRALGATPKIHVAVSAGSHQVKFVNNEQQLSATMNVSVGAGQTAYAITRLH